MPIEDQPPPVASDHPASWGLVIADVQGLGERYSEIPKMSGLIMDVLDDMQARDQLGFERYGKRLQAGNGRLHLVDAYQECLDLIVYLRTQMQEQPEWHVTSLTIMYWSTINHAILLRDLIDTQTRERYEP